MIAKIVQKYLPKSESTVKGHLKHTFKNISSTKPSTPNIKQEPQESDVLEFTKHNENTRTHGALLSVTNMNGKISTNQTGRFPITSTKNNKYVMISYDYGFNKINAEYLKSRSVCVLKIAYEIIHKLLKSRV